MDGCGVQMEFFIDPGHEKHPEQEPIGLRHFALEVDNLEEEIARLLNESHDEIEVGPIMNDWIGERFCHIKDYDGLVVELHE